LIVATKVFVFGLFGEKRVFLFIEILYFPKQNKKITNFLDCSCFQIILFLFYLALSLKKKFDSCTTLVGGHL